MAVDAQSIIELSSEKPSVPEGRTGAEVVSARLSSLEVTSNVDFAVNSDGELAFGILSPRFPDLLMY